MSDQSTIELRFNHLDILFSCAPSHQNECRFECTYQEMRSRAMFVELRDKGSDLVDTIYVANGELVFILYSVIVFKDQIKYFAFDIYLTI